MPTEATHSSPPPIHPTSVFTDKSQAKSLQQAAVSTGTPTSNTDVDGIPFSASLEIEPALKYRQLTPRELWSKVVKLSRIKNSFDIEGPHLGHGQMIFDYRVVGRLAPTGAS